MRRSCTLLLALGIGGLVWFEPTQGADDAQVMRKLYAHFEALPPARQFQLRKLDEAFQQLNEENQNHLRKVLEHYQTWLAQLPEADRKRVIEAPTADDRLAVVKRLRELDWVATLPKAYREEFARAEKRADQMTLIAKWREEERARQNEWDFARAHWEELHQETPAIPSLFKDEKFRNEIDAYARNLESQLPAASRDFIRNTLELKHDQRSWWLYTKTLMELSDRHTLYPVKPDAKYPVSFDTLPEKVREQLHKDAPKTLGKGIKKHPQVLLDATGSWPAYALALTDYVHTHHKLKLTEPLGPCRKTDMPDEVQKFITVILEPTLAEASKNVKAPEKAEQAKKDIVNLVKAEGKFPDYPKAVMDLAKQYKLYIPGWMLPNRAEVWEKIRRPVVRKG